MKYSIVFSILLVNIVIVSQVAVLCASREFDFFFFVQEWPGSYCDTRRSCCYPTSGKPAADFNIHGLWPNYNDGSYPANCNDDSPFDESVISDLKSELQKNWPTLACPSANGIQFWTHEWEKHGTCSETILDQHQYFEAALNLKKRIPLLDILQKAGIQPDGNFYSLNSISEAIKGAIGFAPEIHCNSDQYGTSQLYEIYICVDTTATNLIKCPTRPKGRQCRSEIQFPYFGEASLRSDL